MLSKVFLFSLIFLFLEKSLFGEILTLKNKKSFINLINSINSMEAVFSQKTICSDVQKTESNKVLMHYKYPNKLHMSLESKDGNRFEIIQNEDVGVFSDIRLKQTTYMSKEQIKQNNNIFQFRIKNDDKITYEEIENKKLYKICKNDKFKYCFIFDKNSFDDYSSIKGLVFEDQKCSSTIFFDILKVNLPIEDKEFKIRDFKLSSNE